MIVQIFKKGNKHLELHRHEGVETDDDGRAIINEYWECRISDGRKLPFASADIAAMFITQNLWERVDI